MVVLECYTYNTYIYVRKPKGAQFSDSTRKTIKNMCSDSTRKCPNKIVKNEQKI